MGLFWFVVLADFFIFYLQRAVRDWRGLNQTMPEIMQLIFILCQTAWVILMVFVFIRVRPWWYGLVMIAAGYIVPMLLPPNKTLELIVAVIGIVAAPAFVVLSYLKVFAVI